MTSGHMRYRDTVGWEFPRAWELQCIVVSRLMQNYIGPHSQVQFSVSLINLSPCGHQEAGLSDWWLFCGWKKLCNQPLFKLLQDFLTSNLFPTNNALCFCLYTTFVCMGSLLAVAGLLNGLFFSYHLTVTSSCISLVQLSIVDAITFEHIIPVW
jgi:hypothetical protein